MLHHLELLKHNANTEKQKHDTRIYNEKLKEKAAQNMVSGSGAIKHPDGYIVIGRQAYGTAEALEKARENIAYFEKHGKHMPPLPYPISPYLKGVKYPDVTKKVNEELRKIDTIMQEVSQYNVAYKNAWFKENFPNDAPWDTQVNHGLPGQVLLSQNPLLFADQYALFNGKIRKAGYISNFVYGYAAAKAGFVNGYVNTAAHFVSFGTQGKLDNPADQQAITDGWINGHSKEVKLLEGKS